MSSGVPQGTYLGPLFFNIYINDTSNIIKSSIFLLFEDNLKIFKTIFTPRDAKPLQNDLDNANKQSKTNGLDINFYECFILSFTRNTEINYYDYTLDNKPIQRSTCVKDLRVWLDTKLEFEVHIDKLYRKTIQILGFLKPLNKTFF